MKRFLALVFTLTISLTFASPTLAVSNEPSTWADVEVDEAISLGLVPTTFQSNYTAPTTRAEYCLLVMTLLEALFDESISDVVATYNKGIDASFNDTATPYILAAANLGIVNGVGGGAFAPKRTLIRADAATMLGRTISLFGLDDTEAHDYDDAAEIPSYAAEPLATMRAYGIMNGDTNNRITPRSPYTREAAILTALRLYKVVKAALPCFVINHASADMVIGDTLRLTALIVPDNATDKKVTWESDHPDIASVKDGVVTAKANGQAQITAMAGGKTGVCNITVSEKQVAVTGVTLDMTALTMAKDSTAELVATVQPENASNKTVVWQSSDEGTVSVDGGKLTAKKAGSAKITATAGGFMATCEVTVVDNSAASFTVSGGPSASLLVYSADLTSMFGAGGQVCVWGNSDGSYQHATDAITGEDAGLIFGNRGNISLTSGQVREGMWGKPVNVSDISSDSVPLDYNRSKPYTMKIVGAQDVIKIVEDESREYGNIEVVAFLKPGDTPKSTTIVVTSPWDGTSVTIPVTIRYLPVYDINSAEYRSEFGHELLRLCNEARKEVGVAAMTYADEYQGGSDIRAEELIEKYSHTRPNGQSGSTAFYDVGYYRGVGENIAGYPGASNTLIIHDAKILAKYYFDTWMRSEGHRKNILAFQYKKMVASVFVNWNNPLGGNAVQNFLSD